MAVISPTSSNFRQGANSTVATGTAGESINAFDLVYLKTSDGKYWKAVNTTAAESIVAGVAATNASADDQIVVVPPGGSIESSSALWTKGYTYILGDTGNEGKMMDAADITAGQYVTVVGTAESTTVFQFIVTATGLTG